jgi:cytosine/adenosine deaminase-related metal-dependent hydrolase
VPAGNRLAAIEALDAGVTTCVDWSHGLQTTEHAEAAVDALRSVPGRYVLAYGEESWVKGMHPDVPETKILDNPYTYTAYHSGSTHGQ